MTIELEHAIAFGIGGNSQAHLGKGWSQPEPRFTWATGTESHLQVTRNSDANEYVLMLDVVPFIHAPQLPAQRLIVSVNGVVVGSAALERPTLLGYRLPSSVVGQKGSLAVRLQHPDAARPLDFSISDDHRMLSLSFSEARFYRVVPSGLGTHLLPRGTMLSGREAQGFEVPPPRDLNAWVQDRTGLDLQRLALQFESVGENCEFGLVQRACEAEPLGLFRFSSTFLRPLIHGLDNGFEGLGKPENVDPRLEGEAPREFMIHERAYGLVYHSFVYEGDRSADVMREQEAVRLKFLRGKFMEELQRAEKIFVYKRNTPIPEEEILPLCLAVRRHGDNTLLWVVPAERDRPPGTMEVMMPGLLKGYIDRFAPEDNAHDFSFDGWMRVCANALVLARLLKGAA